MSTVKITHKVLAGNNPVPGVQIIARLSDTGLRSDGSTIPRIQEYTTDANGSVSMDLERSEDVVPGGMLTYWSIEVRLPASKGSPEIYTIQPTVDGTLAAAKVSI